MFTKVRVTIAVLSAGLMILATDGGAGDTCTYQLTPVEGGSARVSIREDRLRIKIRDAQPDTLYTVWVDFKSRATDELSDDYPLPAAIERGVAPAFATTAGVTEGMGLDQNGIITDDRGRGESRVDLDYNLLEERASPVVSADLALQEGLHRVGGYWLRIYRADGLQDTDPRTGLPLVKRATAQGITIVGHFDFVTHGHTPGTGGVDHFDAFFGDFPDDCRND
ncbi:MAG: hypothetical protein ACE5K9_11535 [Candidatus Methylomirabilales bacterium]